MILVDTNAWIHHSKKADVRLVGFVTERRVRTCDVVIGEVFLGSGQGRPRAVSFRRGPARVKFVARHPLLARGVRRKGWPLQLERDG